jgi:uncharacterized membrane protein
MVHDIRPPHETAPIFTAVLKPYRSLSPSGFMLVMMALVASSFAAGLAFWLMGAWPVVGFLGLDILLVQLAFRLNYRAARAAEEISLSREKLTVRRIAASGRTAEFDFNPYWTRLEIDRRPEFGVVALRLATHGKRFVIASFLGPKQREEFATAFEAALREARTAPAA